MRTRHPRQHQVHPLRSLVPTVPRAAHLSLARHRVMTDALNIYDGILKLNKMVLQRRAA
jgi:hypothetical protein